MRRWFEFFRQTPSEEYTRRVLAAVDEELTKLRSPQKSFWTRWQFIFATVTAGLAIVIYKVLPGPSPLSEGFDLEDVALLEDLELFEDLELIENLNEETGELES